MSKKGFTLIELLVVVLIIAILATVALPKYMATRDRSHLSGLMIVGKNVNDSLDRISSFDSTPDGSALERLDISFNDNAGTDCSTSDSDGDGNYGTCRITISGKDYKLIPNLNNYGSGFGNNFTTFYSYTNTSFAAFYVYTDTANPSFNYGLHCTYVWGGQEVTLDSTKCERMALSLGADCNSGACYFN